MGTASTWNVVMRNTLNHPQINMRDDAAEKILDQVLDATTICSQHLAKKVLMKWLTLNNAKKHSIRTKPFKSADKKVSDHNHLTGEYRGLSHNAWNLSYCIDLKKVKTLCIFHNLKGILFYVLAIFWNTFWQLLLWFWLFSFW